MCRPHVIHSIAVDSHILDDLDIHENPSRANGGHNMADKYTTYKVIQYRDMGEKKRRDKREKEREREIMRRCSE